MASTTQLERISGLVEKLEPISNKQRGMRIEAEQWNTLVEVLLGVLQLDRLQEQRTENLLEKRFAAKDHEHLGQVSLAWLDSDLQSRLGGGENSIATRQVIAEMDQKIRSLSAQVAKLSSALENSQRVLDDTIVSNANKTKALLGFEERFKGVEDLRTTVTTLSNDVGSVRVNVDKVLELRKSLQDEAGNPINVAQIKRDLTDLQSVRENLKGSDGKPLRLRDLEVKIQEVADVVGTGGSGGLDGRFASFSASLQDTLASHNEASVKEAKMVLLAENLATENRLRNEIQTSASQVRAATAQQLATQIGNTTADFNSTLDIRLNGLKDIITKDALDNTRSLLNQRLSEVPDQIRNQLDTAVGTLRSTLTANLQASLGAELTAQLKGTDTLLSQQIAAVQASSTALAESLPGVITSGLDNALPELRNTLNQFTIVQVGTAKTALEAGLDTRVSAAVSRSLQNLDSRISSAVTQQTSTIDGKIATAVGTATKNVPAQVADEVRLQISGANLDGKIQDNAKAITTQMRSELKSALAEQDARTSGAIQSSVALLQGQISAARASVLQDAREFSLAQSGALRGELTTLIDTRVRSTRDTVLATVDTRLKTTQDAIRLEVKNQVDTQIRTVNDKLSTRLNGLETKVGRIN